MEAVCALWEDNWADGAVLRDRERSVFADPAQVRRIEHDGPQYGIGAMHLYGPSPQGTPVLHEAGASERERVFAGRHVECVFVHGTSPPWP